MKLSLLVENQSEAENFRFHPFAEGSGVFHEESDFALSLADDILPVYLTYALAERVFGHATQLHIGASLSVLYCPASPWEDLLESLAQRPVFVFADDACALELFAGLNPVAIGYLAEFYSVDNFDKVLIVSRQDTLQAIIGQTPASFLHLLITQGEWRLCLAKEMLPNDAGLLLAALRLAEGLAERVSSRKILPLEQARQTLITSRHSYGFFADRYDEYMAHVDYDHWYHLLRKWYENYSVKSLDKVLEIACGTAAIAACFAGDGAEVHACDASTQMLENAELRGANIRLYQAFMTDPIPEKDFDLIVCMFDSINYLCDKAELSRCLHEVRETLAPGALFIFDISTLGNSLDNFSDECTLVDEPKGVMVHHAFYEPWSKRQMSRLELFEQWGEGYFRRSELHRQKVYLAQELVALIEKSSLELLAIYGNEAHINLYPKRLDSADGRYNRLYFVLRKP